MAAEASGPNQVFILFGSNIAPERNVRAAVALLRQWTVVQAVSPVYETLPVGPPGQPNFLNVAALVETRHGPAALKKAVLDRIERRLQRRRQANRNAPRTIDADIILFNDDIFDLGQRHIPDPDLLRYAHVAVPLAALAPERRHPETGEALAAIAARLLVATATGGQPPLWPRPDLIL
jgi:2-amino-4-hydroxy-6-hydroxymethyldihydropteridine diphosphokinase